MDAQQCAHSSGCATEHVFKTCSNCFEPNELGNYEKGYVETFKKVLAK